MVRAAAACFVVVGWMCLLYNTQVVLELEDNAPTMPQPCETFPQYFTMIK